MMYRWVVVSIMMLLASASPSNVVAVRMYFCNPERSVRHLAYLPGIAQLGFHIGKRSSPPAARTAATGANTSTASTPATSSKVCQRKVVWQTLQRNWSSAPSATTPTTSTASATCISSITTTAGTSPARAGSGLCSSRSPGTGLCDRRLCPVTFCDSLLLPQVCAQPKDATHRVSFARIPEMSYLTFVDGVVRQYLI